MESKARRICVSQFNSCFIADSFEDFKETSQCPWTPGSSSENWKDSLNLFFPSPCDSPEADEAESSRVLGEFPDSPHQGASEDLGRTFHLVPWDHSSLSRGQIYGHVTCPCPQDHTYSAMLVPELLILCYNLQIPSYVCTETSAFLSYL